MSLVPIDYGGMTKRTHPPHYEQGDTTPTDINSLTLRGKQGPTTDAERIALLQYKLTVALEALERNQSELNRLRTLAKKRPGGMLDLACEVAALRREFQSLRRLIESGSSTFS